MQAIFQMTLDTHAALTTEAAREPGNVEPSSILLFVHAAAHDAAMQAVSSAAAQHSVTLLPRCATLSMPHGIFWPLTAAGYMPPSIPTEHVLCVFQAWKGLSLQH